jgi:NADP-dependent 3-hydroxy acid dehydrogenase YdfG
VIPFALQIDISSPNLSIMASTIVLISGTSRGLGNALLERYIAKPNHIVIAANRNPDDAGSKGLTKFPTGTGSRLIVVKLDATNETDALEAVEELRKQGIDHVDTVIANAGTARYFDKVSEIKISNIREIMELNTFGVVRLYQATLPLLLKSSTPKWITMGSTAGSIGVSHIVHRG